CSRSWPCSRWARCVSRWRADDSLIWSEFHAGQIDGIAIAGRVGRKRDSPAAAPERDELHGLGEIERNQQPLALGLARVREDAAGRGNAAVRAPPQRRRRL